MRTMLPRLLPRLRSLIIAVAAVSTVCVGLCDRLADARAVADGRCSVEGEACFGSHEDDSGTRSEQIEQDDGDEQSGRDVHFLAGGTVDLDSDTAVRPAAVQPRCRGAESRRLAALVRGPPPAG